MVKKYKIMIGFAQKRLLDYQLKDVQKYGKIVQVKKICNHKQNTNEIYNEELYYVCLTVTSFNT